MANDKAKFNPPPAPSTPEAAPWTSIEALVGTLDKLTTALQTGMGLSALGIPGGEMGAAAVSVVAGIPGTPGTVSQLINIIAEGTPGALGPVDVIPFEKSLDPETKDFQTRMVRFKGIVTVVIMSFPAGCNQLVDVRLLYIPKAGGKECVVPTIDEQYIHLDDVTQPFYPEYLVEAPGTLRVEWINYDTLNSHTVPVIVSVKPTLLSRRSL